MEKLLRPVELNEVSYARNKTRFQKKFKSFTFFTAAIMLMFFSFTASASHFRYGNISWTRVSETPTTVTIKLNVSLSWGAFFPTNAQFRIFSGNSTTTSNFVNVPLTNVLDASGLFTNSVGTANVTLAKSAVLYTIAFNSANKIVELSNNSNGPWNVFTVVNTNAPGSSPVSTLPAIVNMPVGISTATYTIPATDPDANSTLTYRFATTQEMLGRAFLNQSFYSSLGSQPAGLTINPSTGELTYNTTNLSVGLLYNAGVVVTDNDGNQIFLDFIIQITRFSSPPVFDYTVTPANGTIYNVIAGQNLNFNLKAGDSDGGSTVSFSASGLPSYISSLNNFSPSLPAIGNPAQTTFSYTPAAAQIGSTTVLNFIATDNVGVQSSTSVTVRVVAEPAPIFSANTPSQNTFIQIPSGVLYQTPIEALSSLGSNVVMAFANIPAAASLSPTVPTTAAPLATTNFSWTPSPSNFGINNLSFIAQIASIPTIFSTRNFSIIVNTPPVFTSTPPSADVVFGQPFSYSITASDVEIPFGDVVDIISSNLPSWLTITQTGNGTALLSGTPTAADGGKYSIKLEAEDTYHHGNPSHVEQEFEINVLVCNTVLSSSITDVTCAGSSDGKIDLTIAGGKAPFIYAWSNGASTEDLLGLAAGNYTVVVTDANNCTETLTVSVQTTPDVTKPIVLTQNRTIQLDASGNASITVADINNRSTDNCAIASVVLDKTSFSCANVGKNEVTLTVTDASGNISSAIAEVTVEDKIAPTVLTQNITVQLNATGNAFITPSDVDNNSTDICGIASYTLSKTAFDCSNVGNNTVILTVTDVNGNVATASATVTVQDNIAPTVITKNISVDLVGGNVSITAAQINNGSFDNCSIASMAINKTSFDCSSIGNHTVTLTVTDVNGNVSSATAVVTVVGELTTSSIASVPTSNTYTGGVATNLFLGYGSQSTTLQISNLVSGGNGVDPRSYTYQWTGTGLSSTTSGSPVFTPTAAGFYNFSVIITNKYGCKSTASISICVKDIREKDKNGKFSGKVFICHAPPGNVGNSNTLSISVNAVASHLSQHSFDRLGTCADAPCTSTGLATNSVGGTSTENNVLISDLNVNSTEFLAYPNPFGKQTTVRFTLPYQEDNVTLDIYDLKGTKIQTLFNGNANAQTTYEVQFNGQNLSAGTYFFRLITAKEVKNFKVIMGE